MPFMDWVHGTLDVAGMVPVIGEVADGVNAGLYAAQGDFFNAGVSLAGMIPIGGQAATLTRLGVKAGTGIAEQVGKQTAKQVGEEVAQQGAKKTGKEVAESGSKFSRSPAVEKALSELGSFKGKTRKEIRKKLKDQGYVKQKNGVYTKDLGDGTSVGVRMDPGVNKAGNPLDKGGYASQRGTSGSLHADSVPHVHKEIVPTSDVASGKYMKPGYGGATKLNDNGFPSSNPLETHIPTQK